MDIPITSTAVSPAGVNSSGSSTPSSNSDRKTQVRFCESTDILLLKAAIALAPWLAEHGKVLAKWDAVADDFNLATKGIFFFLLFAIFWFLFEIVDLPVAY